MGLALAPFLAAQQPANDPGTPAKADADRMGQAEALLERGDYKGAEIVLKELSVTRPKDALVQFDLGFTEEHNGEDEAAQSAYTAAVATDPQMAQARLALGLLQAREGHAGEARPQLEAAANLAAAPPAVRGRALRALARLDEARDPAQAVDELLRATQLTGEQPEDAELSASLASRAGSAADAEATYRRLLQTNPSDAGAIAGLSGILQSEGKLAEADALLRPAAAQHPDDARLLAQLATLDAAEDRPAEAIALLTGLRAASPRAAEDPALTRLLAHLDLVSGNVAAARPLYEALVQADPADPRLLDDLGSTLVRLQQFGEAQAVFTKALGLRNAFHDDAAWGEVAGHLAFAASRNHDPNGALQALAARATVLPNSPASLFLEATAHDALHQNRQAITSYRAFLAMAGGKLPDEEFEARHRLVTLTHEH